jgi:hypothetical protein
MSDSLENSSSEFCKRSPEQLDMSFFDANGITFQHGLGADLSQPLSFFAEDHPFRLISWTQENRLAWKPPLSEV